MDMWKEISRTVHGLLSLERAISGTRSLSRSSPPPPPPPPIPHPHLPPTLPVTQDHTAQPNATRTQAPSARDAIKVPGDRPHTPSPNVLDAARDQEAPVPGTSSASTPNADTAPPTQPPQTSQLPKAPSTSAALENPEIAEPTVEPAEVAAAGGRTSSNAIKTALGSLLSVLKVAEKASAPLPPLQAALGAVAASIEIYSQFQSNTDTIRTFKQRVDPLVEMIQKLVRSPSNSPELLQRLHRFEKEVRDVAARVERLSASGWVKKLNQVIQAEGVSEQLDGEIKNLSSLVEGLKTEGALATWIAVERIDAKLDLQIHYKELEILGNLNHVSDARYNDSQSSRVECTPSTRKEVLSAIRLWIAPELKRADGTISPISHIPEDVRILLISGQAGSGKSTIANTIASWCDRTRRLGASFFCARAGSRSDIHRIFPTIAHQLAVSNLTFAKEVIKALSANPDIHRSKLSYQLEKLIVEPLAAIKAAPLPSQVVIIDALDECCDTAVVSVILMALSEFVDGLRSLKFVITSRPEARIVQGFRGYDLLRQNTHHFPLNEIPRDIMLDDVAIYIDEELVKIRNMYGKKNDWPSLKKRNQLKTLTSGVFIVIATALKFIMDPDASDPDGQLDIVLSISKSDEDSPTAPLDELYLGVLDAAISTKTKKAKMVKVQSVVSAVVLLRDQVSTGTLDFLLGLPEGTSNTTLEMLSSVIALPNSNTGVIQIIHPSFHDFLVNSSRCTRTDLLVQPRGQHLVLAKRCLKIMMTVLGCDTSNISESTRAGSNIHEFARDHPLHVQYALRHWSHHLLEAEMDRETATLVETFSQKHLLHWLETLILMGKAEIIVDVLKKARRALNFPSMPSLKDTVDMLHDGERMVQLWYPTISTSTSTIYTAALPLCPISTRMRTIYAQELHGPISILGGLPDCWSVSVSTMQGYRGNVRCAAYSPDGAQIATVSDDRKIRLWDARTGFQVLDLPEKRSVLCVGFSPDGKEILLGSNGGMVYLWSVGEPRCVASHKAHSDSVLSVAYSFQGSYFASGSKDNTVKLWNLNSEKFEPEITLNSHSNSVNSVAFSHNGSFLLSGSDDNTCRIWSLPDTSHIRTLEHNFSVKAVAVSSDNKMITCGGGKAVVLWAVDASSGSDPLRRLEMPGDVRALDFSPHSSALAVGCDIEDRSSISLWDLTTSEPLGESEHIPGELIFHLRFSPDGANLVSSHSRTARTWDMAVMQASRPRVSGDAAAMGDGVQRAVCAVAFSPHNNDVLAAALEDGTVQVWDVSTSKIVDTLEPPDTTSLTPEIVALAWSFDGSRLALSGRKNHSIVLYDRKHNNSASVLRGHENVVVETVFAPYSMRLISGSLDGTVRGWDAKTRCSIEVYRGKCEIWALATSSREDRILFSSLDDSPVSGSRPHPKVHTSLHPFSQGDRNFSLSRGYPTIRLRDLTSCSLLWEINHTHAISSIAFSSDDMRIVGAHSGGMTSLWDISVQCPPFSTSRPASAQDSIKNTITPRLLCNFNARAEGSRSLVNHIAFSADGCAVVSYDEYTPIPSFDSPPTQDQGTSQTMPHQSGENTSLKLPSYCQWVESDGWIWRAGSDGKRSRIRWLPAIYRFTPGAVCEVRGGWNICGDRVALATNDGRLVVVDASDHQ